MSLEIVHVTKRFGALHALDDVSLTIERGALVCFLGPSGCGKTTLLRIVAGLEQADAGQILLDGQDLMPVPARNRNFGVVFQSYSLFPNMTIAANIAYGLECRKWTRQQIAARVEEMLSLVHLNDQAHKFPHQLSGGQQQRIALARALAPRPSLLLLDEPLSALDAKVREELRDEIRQLQKQLGITTIMVTHDQEEALAMADRIVVMQAGRIMQSGSSLELYSTPQNRFVAGFIGKMNVYAVNGSTPFPDLLDGLQAAVFGIRPEDVRLCTADTPGAFQGEIVKIVRLGNLTRITLQLPDAHGGVQVVSEQQGLCEQLAPGMTTRFVVARSALRVLE